MTSTIIVPLCGGNDIPSLPNALVVDNRSNSQSPCEIYQEALEMTKSDVLIYAHDDLEIMDGDWNTKVMEQFLLYKDCVAVGLGGATGLGNKDLYRKPFNIWNMARKGYASNQKDAEVHGERFTGVRRVAVLDAFFMAIRTDFLRGVGGWPVDRLTHHCLDLWLACEAARAGNSTFIVGIECHHHGGRSSTSPGYRNARWIQGGTLESEHILPHQWIFDSYRDVLPIEV